ncbi:MAG: peptide-methionine (S)-S-oxide reductase MsrA [bacterium]
MINLTTVYLGGGCFWCTEAIFRSLKGVSSVESGYMGGNIPNPTYEKVSSGTTGHAEVVKIKYNEEEISTPDILEIFFDVHDPATLNRQGSDVGTQYRSVIFYTEEIQKFEAELIIKKLNKLFESSDKKVVTELVPVSEFYPAEEYHKEYYKNNSSAPYCQLVISPKLEKLQKQFGDKLN